MALLIVFRALVVDMLKASGAVLVVVMRWVGGWVVEQKCHISFVFCMPVCVICVPVIVFECMWSVRIGTERKRYMCVKEIIYFTVNMCKEIEKSPLPRKSTSALSLRSSIGLLF